MTTPLKKIVLFDIDYTLFDTAHFKESGLSEYRLYEEVIPVLEKLSTTVELGIFSEGEKELQMSKLVQTMIDAHFLKDHLHILLKKIDSLDDIFSLYKKRRIYLVDDKLSILSQVHKKYSEVETIWIKRGPYALSQSPLPDFSPSATVTTLKEIVPFIKE